MTNPRAEYLDLGVELMQRIIKATLECQGFALDGTNAVKQRSEVNIPAQDSGAMMSVGGTAGAMALHPSYRRLP